MQPDLCYLTAGDTAKALASLETQLAHGHTWSWYYDHRMPMYDLIRHEPQYLAMMETFEQRLETQRQLIAETDADS